MERAGNYNRPLPKKHDYSPFATSRAVASRGCAAANISGLVSLCWYSIRRAWRPDAQAAAAGECSLPDCHKGCCRIHSRSLNQPNAKDGAWRLATEQTTKLAKSQNKSSIPFAQAEHRKKQLLDCPHY